MGSMRILIKGGKVVNDDFTQEADVYIENGIIQQVNYFHIHTDTFSLCIFRLCSVFNTTMSNIFYVLYFSWHIYIHTPNFDPHMYSPVHLQLLVWLIPR